MATSAWCYAEAGRETGDAQQFQTAKRAGSPLSKEFTEKSIVYTGGPHLEQKLPYLLLIPSHFESGSTYPLVIWLHGIGPDIFAEKGLCELRHVPAFLASAAKPSERDFFLLVPHTFDHQPWATGHGQDQGVEGDPLDYTFEILQQVLRVYPVDQNRLSVVGISAGATASWELAMRHPATFAAVMPFGSGSSPLHATDAFRRTTVWAFHGGRDQGADPENVRMMVQQLKGSGNDATLTMIEDAGHFVWDPAFQDYGVRDWLLAQRLVGDEPTVERQEWKVWRTKASRTAVAQARQWWKFVTVGAVPLTIAVIIYRDRLTRARRVGPAVAEVRDRPAGEKLS